MKKLIATLLSTVLYINIYTAFSMDKQHPRVNPAPLHSMPQEEAKKAVESAMPLSDLANIIYDYSLDEKEANSFLEVDYPKVASPLFFCLQIAGEDVIYDCSFTLEFMEATKHHISGKNISRKKVADLWILTSSKSRVAKIQRFEILDKRYNTPEWRQQFLFTLILGPGESLALKKIKYDKDQDLIKEDIDLEKLRKKVAKMNVN